jgi:hypothetical protein
MCQVTFDHSMDYDSIPSPAAFELCRDPAIRDYSLLAIDPSSSILLREGPIEESMVKLY